ncbi:hypothetical protein [Candidatus Similichlamydia laticola]|uniref:Translation elongation factor P n=1 Tax=Candidatus Similichlamydia laticola TaxID=2170265 RepID=A0A369KAD1_9BACT|nr:hypothetical protein [Candidatus Similichlamydia laticola]RDB31561.1 Translation elongation factor P [Candidatus Similichlamydia laticola]
MNHSTKKGTSTLTEKGLEFLYIQDDHTYLFLDMNSLNMMPVPRDIIDGKALYLKEGVVVRGRVCEEEIISIELPQFLELMVSKVETCEEEQNLSNATLETGAIIKVPPFIESGDIVKVDTRLEEYIQRI